MMQRLLTILFLAFAVSAPWSAAQEPATETFEFLAGTTFEDGGQTFAFLVRQAGDSNQLKDPLTLHLKTTGSFNSVGMMALQSRRDILSVILSSLPAPVANTTVLELAVDELFGDLLPAAGLTLADKLSGLMQVAAVNPDVHSRLYFLSRTEPVLGLCMGTVAVQSIPSTGISVFELRDGETVVGRVSLNPAAPATIPAPANLVEIPEPSPKGNLSAKFAWDTPAALARVSPLTYGYHLYRIEETYAGVLGANTTPPTPEDIQMLVETKAEVVRVNEVPILPGAPGSAFVLDNNRAFDDGGTPFNDGERFYYFVAAADLLGRPGNLSAGLLVTICDRMPPLPPTKVRVENHFDSSDAASSQRFKITWEEPPNADADPPDSYLLYRWDDINSNPASGDTTNSLIDADAPVAVAIGAPIPHDPGTRRYSFIDNSTSAPKRSIDAGKSVWYTVRAVKSAACGDLISGDSAPAWGVLREREGPPAPSGRIHLKRYCPEITAFNTNVIPFNNADLSSFYGLRGLRDTGFKVVVTRLSPQIESVTISTCVGLNPQETILPRVVATKNFDPGVNVIEIGGYIDLDQWVNYGILLTVTDSQGKTVSIKHPLNIYEPALSGFRVFNISVDETVQTSTFINGSRTGGSGIHNPVVPDGSGTLNPVELEFSFVDPAREFKLYKRIDAGPLLLIKQGTDEEFPTSATVAILFEDDNLPANAAEVCYFLQVFDRHGNPSPLALLGCFQTTPRVPLTAPLITTISTAGDLANATATINWFCPPDGIDRFRVYLADGITRVGTNYLPDLTRATDSIAPGGIIAISPGVLQDGRFFSTYQTGRIAGTLGNPAEPGVYSITIPVRVGADYQVFIRSVTASGETSPASATHSFIWSPASAPIPAETPWPARALPTAESVAVFNGKIIAQYIPAGSDEKSEAAIRIGELGWDIGYSPQAKEAEFGRPPEREGNAISVFSGRYPNNGNYTLELYHDELDRLLFPFVVYRYQVPSLAFPQVSNQVVQVTPLIDRLRKTVDATSVTLLDPFISLEDDPLLTADPQAQVTNPLGLYVRDTQGVIKGARYVYLIARFKENRELDRVYQLNPLAIPD